MVWEIVSIAATFVALRSRSMKSECWVMAFAREGTSIPSEPTTPMRDALVRLPPPSDFAIHSEVIMFTLRFSLFSSCHFCRSFTMF